MIHVVMFSNENKATDFAVPQWEPLLTSDIDASAANVFRRAVNCGKYRRVAWLETDGVKDVLIRGFYDAIDGGGISTAAFQTESIASAIEESKPLCVVHYGCKGG